MRKVSGRKIHICFITTGLLTGGAEVMLYKLLARINREVFQVSVISLRDRGTLGKQIEALGIKVFSVNIHKNPLSFYSLVGLIKRLSPDILQGWMYHGNLGAQAANFFLLRKLPVTWSIHNSLDSLNSERGLTKAIIKWNACLSKHASEILYVGKKIKTEHQLFGFDSSKGKVIPNGFDTDTFVPSISSRELVRHELGLPKGAFVIGLIGRYHSVKDHPNFLRAAEIVNNKYSNVYFLLAGRDVDDNNEELVQLVRELGIERKVKMLGERQDVPRLLAALDIACSSSYSEAFPLILGEAMSCGIPCVATEVGDSAWIIGDTGFLVPPRDAVALADAWEKVINLDSKARKALGEAARKRILENFSLNTVVQQYESLYEELAFQKKKGLKEQKIQNNHP